MFIALTDGSQRKENMNLPTEDHVEELQQAFRTVCNPEDWKAPINAVIKFENRNLVAEAISFMTATEATFENLGAGRLRVRSVGYRNGPAGDH